MNTATQQEPGFHSNDLPSNTPQHLHLHVERIGAATLYLGNAEDVLPTLDAGSIHMVWTDPPYGYKNADDRDFLSRREHIMGDGDASSLKPIINDDKDSARTLIDMMLREAARLLPKTGTIACCSGGGSGDLFTWLAQRMNTEGLSFYHAVIWDKCTPGIGWRYRRQYETVMVGHRTDGAVAWNPSSQALSNVIRASKPRSKYHPNIKPLALIEPMVYAHTLIDEVVLDPFMGSGSTGVAAVQQGRRFIGVEYDPDYFEVSCKRIEQAQKQRRMIA